MAKQYLICVVVMVIMIFGGPVHADLSLEEQQILAQRFRPYVKTTLDSGSLEQIHPCNWQWFVAHSTMVRNYEHDDGTAHGCAGLGTWDTWPDGVPVLTAGDLSNSPGRLIEPPFSDVRALDAGTTDLKYALHLDSDQYHAGEDWNDVVHSGHGFYAHVELVPLTEDKIVNIEYSILWAYNDAYCSQHNGDITTITVVYDRGADLVTRVTYSIHGVALESFRLASPQSISFRLLQGRDQNDAYFAMAVVVLSLSEADQYQQGDNHSPSDSYVYLAQDPVSLRYEHPVVFAEYGAHELWPNSSGSVTTAPAHDGDGFSFLPDTVQILGTLDRPNAGYEPFLYYNGKFGTDPQAIILHRTWFWPDGRGHTKARDQDHPAVIPTDVPDSRFADKDPYVPNGGLDWPPRLENANGPVTVYVDHVVVYSNYVTGTTFNGSASSPFPDPMTANSFVPKGGVVVVAAGTYPGRAVLSRACKLVSRGGTVTIGNS